MAEEQGQPRDWLFGHLHLSVAAPSFDVVSILHCVLCQLPSRGASQDCGVVLLFKHTRLIADSDPVTRGQGERETNEAQQGSQT